MSGVGPQAVPFFPGKQIPISQTQFLLKNFRNSLIPRVVGVKGREREMGRKLTVADWTRVLLGDKQTMVPVDFCFRKNETRSPCHIVFFFSQISLFSILSFLVTPT